MSKLKYVSKKTITLREARWGMVKGSRIATRYTAEAETSEPNLAGAHKKLRNGDELVVLSPNRQPRTHIRQPDGWTCPS